MSNIWKSCASLAIVALFAIASLSFANGKGGPPILPIGEPTLGEALDNKLDPGLRFMLKKYLELSDVASRSPEGEAVLDVLIDGNSYFKLHRDAITERFEAPVFIKLENPSLIGELEQRGVTIVTQVDDIVIARLPITEAYAVAALPNVHSMQISGMSYPLLDVSRAEAKVDVVHAGGGGLDRAYRGNGVVVGVLDSGIDWSHPDFSTAAGSSRIHSILEFLSNGQSRECTKAQIEANQCQQIDGPGGGGHGTHVAGTAAGGGRRNASYIGMAPESEIVFVKGIRDHQSQGGFQDADVVAGTQYIFQKARSLNKPAVVNLSLGGHFGPHDGTSLYEQALSSLVRPGNIIVAAAGNEGSDYIHGGYATLPGSGWSDSRETITGIQEGYAIGAIDIWYPASGTISFGLAAYQIGNYDPSAVLGFTNPVPPGQKIENLPFTIGQTTLGVVTIDATTISDPNNGARRVVIIIDSNNGQFPISGVAWSIYTVGSGTFDMWSVVGAYFPPISGLPHWFIQGNNDKSVGMPGTAKKVICVGSYVSKNQWIDMNNQTQLQPGIPFGPTPTVGNISYFSSRGPSRDGRIKPDFAAPGEAIIAALSSSLVIGTHVPSSDILQGGGMLKTQGTSMASPHVTGIVGLMLEKNRFLSYDNVVRLLSTTANPVGGTNNTFGAGKVRAVNALLATPPAIDCVTLSKLTGIDCDGNRIGTYQLLYTYPNPFNPATNIAFRLAREEKVNLTVYDVLGRPVRTLVDEELTEGIHQTMWDGTNETGQHVSTGVYFARISTPGFVATNRLLLVK